MGGLSLRQADGVGALGKGKPSGSEGGLQGEGWSRSGSGSGSQGRDQASNSTK